MVGNSRPKPHDHATSMENTLELSTTLVHSYQQQPQQQQLVLQAISEDFIFEMFAILIFSRSFSICILKQSALSWKLL